MRFSIDRENLVRAMSHMNNIVRARNVIPILNNLLIEAKDGALTVTSNNCDMALAAIVPAKVEVSGATTVEFHKLKSIADTSPPGAEVSFSSDDEVGRADIRTGRARVKLLTLPAVDFPVFTMPEGLVRFTLPGADMRRLLSVGDAAASEDKARPYLEGVYLHRVKDTLAAVATDGHQLAFADVPMEVDMPGIIVPNEAVRILRGLVSDDVAAIEIDSRKIAVAFDRGRLTLRFVSKLLDGTYPDYTRAFSEPKDGRFVVSSEALALSVKRAMIAQNGSSSAIRLALSEGKLSISARSDTGTESSDEVECDWGLAEHTFCINARYLLAAIGSAASKEIQIAPNLSGGPIRIDVPGDRSRFYIIMPMSVQ